MALRWPKLLPARPQPPAEAAAATMETPSLPASPLLGLRAELSAWADTAALATLADSRIDQTLSDVSFGSRDLAASIEKVSETAAQLQVSVADIAAGMEQQSDSLGRATSHSQQVAEEAAHASAEAVRLAAAMREAAASARDGAGAVGTTVALLGQARDAVTRSSEPMSDLLRLSEEISRTLGSVVQIAKLTNMLALNAAIEAARAGEHGRGFAVVADEIRKLADSSSQAARQVGELVGRVREETQRATGLVQAGAARVDEITRTVETAVGGLQGVLQNTAAMESAVEAISASISGVESSSRSLADAISGAAAVSEETTGQAEVIATSARNVAHVMHGAADLAVYFGEVQTRMRRVLAPVRESLARSGRVLSSLPVLESESSSGPVELLWGDWIPWQQSDEWFGLERFMQANPDVRLKLVPAQVELDAFLNDLRIPDVTWAAVNVATQIFEPIDDRLRESGVDLSEYLPGLVETVRRVGGGRIYGLPIHVDVPVLLYNRALFERAGVPAPRAGQTWPDLIRSLQQVSAKTGAHGLDIHWSHGFDSFCQHFLSPTGCNLMDDRGQRLMISSQLRDQLQFVWDLQHRDRVLAPGLRQAYEYDPSLIARGQVAAVLTISPMLSVFRQVRQPYEIAPIPSFPSHPGVAPCISFLVVGMSRFTRHKEEAWRFLQFLLTDSRIYADNCRAGRNLSGRLTTAMRAVYEEFGRKNPPANYPAIWSARHAATPLYLFAPGFRRVASIGWQQVQQLLSGQKTVDEALQTLSEFSRLLEH